MNSYNDKRKTYISAMYKGKKLNLRPKEWVELDGIDISEKRIRSNLYKQRDCPDSITNEMVVGLEPMPEKVKVKTDILESMINAFHRRRLV
jgi:hypothetical protein